MVAFIRALADEKVLVVANLSRFGQCAELPLSDFKGMVPHELFGNTPFPPITDAPYLITVGPHSCFWFVLKPRPAEPGASGAGELPTAVPTLNISAWEQVFASANRTAIERHLPEFLQARRWFIGKPRSIAGVRIRDVVEFPSSSSFVIVVQVVYVDGDPETYIFPLWPVKSEKPESVSTEMVFARLETSAGEQGSLYSGLRNPQFENELLGLMSRRKRIAGSDGELVGSHTKQFRKIWGSDRPALEPAWVKADQNNTSIAFRNRFIFKLIRRIEPGVHPELAADQGLAKPREPAPVPPLAGWLEYRSGSGETSLAGILHAFIPHEADAWQFTLEDVSLFFERALSHTPGQAVPFEPSSLLASMIGKKTPELAETLAGSYLNMARLLGPRVAEFHVAMTRVDDPAFSPEPFTDLYRYSLYHGLLAKSSDSELR